VLPFDNAGILSQGNGKCKQNFLTIFPLLFPGIFTRRAGTRLKRHSGD
jgi:hypothetical protein